MIQMVGNTGQDVISFSAQVVQRPSYRVSRDKQHSHGVAFLLSVVALSWITNNNVSSFQIGPLSSKRGCHFTALHQDWKPSCHGQQQRLSTRDVIVFLSSDKEEERTRSLLTPEYSPTKEEESSSKSIESSLPASPEPQEESSGIPLILILTFFVATLSALDRVAMSVAILPLSTELSLTETAKGQISSAFSFGYGLAIIPCGLILSNFSPRLAMSIGVAIWSLGTILTPFAASATSTLWGARAIVGGAESVVLPATQKIIQNWVSRENKSLATAGVFAGFSLGTVSAYFLSPMVMDAIGWRGMFVLYGGVGILWLVPWWILAKDRPPSQERDETKKLEVVRMGTDVVDECRIVNTGTADDASLMIDCTPSDGDGTKEYKLADQTSPTSSNASPIDASLALLRSAPWKGFLTSKGVIAIALAHAANNWGLYNNLSWTPTFYNEQYGLNVRDSALLSIAPSVAGAIGGLIAGTIADKIIQNSNIKDTTLLRKIFQGIALLGPGSILFYLSTHIPSEPVTAQLLLTGTVGLQSFNSAGYGPACQEKAGEKWCGLTYSLTSLPGVMFGTLGVYVTGLILDATSQDWSYVFGLNALIDVIGALFFIAFYDSRKEFD